jgi:uroporphyrinogen decarboxylase
MNRKQRVQAVIHREHPERNPVSFWHHFSPQEITGGGAREAHLAFFEKYDLDFLKVMNDHQFPRGEVEVVQSADDLKRIRPSPGDAGDLSGQLDLLRGLRERLPEDVLMCCTVFNPWAVLRRWLEPPHDIHKPPRLKCEDDRDDAITRLLKEDRGAVGGALEAIAGTLHAFAGACLAAGADGIFLSVRDDWVDRPQNGAGFYDDIVRPTDLHILAAAADAPFNVLHICGKALNFMAFAKYPVQVVNWADRYAGPSIAYARDRVKPAIAGGVDNLKTLPEGTPEDCAAEVRDALRQAKGRPIMISAGCTFDPGKVPPENLEAVVAAARDNGTPRRTP